MTADSTSEARQTEALRAVFQAARSGDVRAAQRLAHEALAAGCEHPVLFNLRALEHEDAGRFDAALEDLGRAQGLAPKDFSILNATGLTLARMGRFNEAVGRYERAIAIRPDFGPAWFNSGWALEQLGETTRAAEAYLKAAELDARNAPAWANAAWLAARRGDEAAARIFAERALALAPGHPTAILALAGAELASEPAAAEARLRALLAQPALGAHDRALALSQLGDVLDALGRPDDAFSAYSSGNQLLRTDAAPRFEAPGQSTAAHALAWLVAWAERLDADAPPRKGPSVAGQGGEREHIFLLGFPRSGTTLMETVLGAHPDVSTLEERNTLQAAVWAFMTDAVALSKLGALGERDLQPFRDDYWASVKAFGGRPDGKIFIDKNPFNTNKLPLIYRLFPDAKIIFAIRDPRDVVLSCFRRRFNLNPSTYELLDLRRAAALYDRTMRLAEILRTKQPMREHGLVYERLVETFAAEAKTACDFIGADWRPELIDFAERGRRGEVASASAAQISRGLYQDGAGQWRRYRSALAPVQEMLAPWIYRFGYPAD